MGFEIGKRVLILCFTSISFYAVVTASEPHHHRGLQRNETVRRAKTIGHYQKYLPENRVDLDDQTRNTLRTVLNAAGVCGLGFLWIKEITAAIGTPILAPFLMPPLLLLTALLLFLPQLRDIFENLLKDY